MTGKPFPVPPAFPRAEAGTYGTVFIEFPMKICYTAPAPSGEREQSFYQKG